MSATTPLCKLALLERFPLDVNRETATSTIGSDSRIPIYTIDLLELHCPGVFIVRCRSDEDSSLPLPVLELCAGFAG